MLLVLYCDWAIDVPACPNVLLQLLSLPSYLSMSLGSCTGL